MVYINELWSYIKIDLKHKNTNMPCSSQCFEQGMASVWDCDCRQLWKPVPKIEEMLNKKCKIGKKNWEWRYSICIKRPSSLAAQIVQLSAFKWLFSGILLAMWRLSFPWKKIFFPLQPPTETKGEPVPRSAVAIPNRTSFATVEKCKVFPHLCINPEQFPSHFQMVPIKSKNPCPNGC